MLETRPCCSLLAGRREKSTHENFDVPRFVKFLFPNVLIVDNDYRFEYLFSVFSGRIGIADV